MARSPEDQQARKAFQDAAMEFLAVMKWEPAMKDIVRANIRKMKHTATRQPSNTAPYKALMSETTSPDWHRASEAILIVLERGILPRAFDRRIYGEAWKVWTSCRRTWHDHLYRSKQTDGWGTFLLSNPDIRWPSMVEKHNEEEALKLIAKPLRSGFECTSPLCSNQEIEQYFAIPRMGTMPKDFGREGHISYSNPAGVEVRAAVKASEKVRTARGTRSE